MELLAPWRGGGLVVGGLVLRWGEGGFRPGSQDQHNIPIEMGSGPSLWRHLWRRHGSAFCLIQNGVQRCHGTCRNTRRNSPNNAKLSINTK